MSAGLRAVGLSNEGSHERVFGRFESVLHQKGPRCDGSGCVDEVQAVQLANALDDLGCREIASKQVLRATNGSKVSCHRV